MTPSTQQHHDFLLLGLNPEQQQVVLHDKGPCLVSAVAGAGKTRALVHRIAYLVQVRGVPANRILATTFTKKGAAEMKGRLDKLIGAKGQSVRTFHSLSAAILREDFPGFDRWDLNDGKFEGLLKEACGYQHLNLVKLKKKVDIQSMLGFIGLCKADMAAPMSDRALEIAQDSDSGMAAQDMIDAYEKTEQLRIQARVMTFDDWLIEVVRLFDENRDIARRWASKFDYVLQDEANDQSLVQNRIIRHFAGEHRNYMAFGDTGQCVAQGTLVTTPEDEIPIEDLKDGDEVISFKNGAVAAQTVTNIWSVGKKDCFIIETEGGKRLTASAGHLLYASPPSIAGDECVVYLMYRNGMGFRLGMSSHGYTNNKTMKFGNRLLSESADRLWVISILKDRETALQAEIEISLTYAIPTLVFNGTNRGLFQGRIDNIFAKFGKNGQKLLDDNGLDFDFPHWASGTSTRNEKRRRMIRVVAHSTKGTTVSLEWFGNDVNCVGIEASVNGRGMGKMSGHRVRRWFASYHAAKKFAEDLLRRCGKGIIREHLGNTDEDEEKLFLSTASSLFPGMKVATISASGLASLDTVKSVTRTTAECFDVSVDDAANYYAGGILSHNCMYAFRGARPEFLVKFQKEWNSKVIKMCANYRSGNSIIDLANEALDGMDPSQCLDVRLDPQRGIEGKVTYAEYANQEEEAAQIVERMIADHNDGAAWSSNVVLYRMNSLSRAVEEALIRRKVPYHIYGGVSFFERREVKDVLAYLRLASGSKYSSIKDARRCINRPNRFLGKNFLERMEVEAAQKPRGSWMNIIERAGNGAGIDTRRKQAAFDWVFLLRGIQQEMARIPDETNDDEPRMTPEQIITKIVKDTGYLDWIRKEEGRDTIENDRISNVAELARAASKFETVAEFLDHVDAHIEANKEAGKEENAHVDRVNVMSCHRGKGLEWPSVYLITCNQFVMPHVRGDVEEEKRIFYVAVTRAKDNLNISCVQEAVSKGQVRPMFPSDFIAHHLEEAQKAEEEERRWREMSKPESWQAHLDKCSDCNLDRDCTACAAQGTYPPSSHNCNCDQNGTGARLRASFEG